MQPSRSWSPSDEHPHGEGSIDEWVFATWTPDGALGFVSGHRLLGRFAWYWSAVVEQGRPLLHLTEWDVRVRADPFVVKAPEMWAEHHCVSPLRQWSVGNEAHAAALDDADEALGRGYGMPTPMASDVEWYAIGGATAIDHGYEQVGVAHGEIELLDRPNIEFVETPAHRWRRWTDDAALAPITLDPVVAHTGLRAPFAFPDGSVADWVVSADGWRSRRRPVR
ncbi:hypothetical protein [Ilumatobacter sp.]|uniref:hypothetical protein n=1 Tax=Ilumatobacter sp. TaxID=1967498 RepID=UPI003AF4FC05